VTDETSLTVYKAHPFPVPGPTPTRSQPRYSIMQSEIQTDDHEKRLSHSHNEDRDGLKGVVEERITLTEEDVSARCGRVNPI